VLRRVADHLFWAARYLERTQWRARLVDVNYHLILEVPPRDADPWEPLLAITAERDIFARRYARADEASVVNFFTFDRDNPASIANCIEAVRLNLSSIRHLISTELWLAVNRLYLKMRDWSAQQAATGLSAFFACLRDDFYSITGVIDATMRRDAAYDFIEIGTMLERADNIARLLDVKYHYLLPRIEDVGGEADLRQWAAVLRSASALEAFRQIYGNSIRVDRVVQMLIFDPLFPRSARYSAERLGAALGRVAAAGGPGDGPHTMAEGLTVILAGGSAGAMIASGLHEFLLGMENQCAVISNSVVHEYMSFG
jgi:uncharacterized alpha-E superfamily protein